MVHLVNIAVKSVSSVYLLIWQIFEKKKKQEFHLYLVLHEMHEDAT